MIKVKPALLAGLAAIALASGVVAEARGPKRNGGAEKVVPGAVSVSYGSDPKQMLDIYPRSGVTKAPILMFVHGGGWAIGKRQNTDVLPEYAARHGMILVSIDYRLVPAVTAKECTEDTAAAVAKVRSIAEKNGGDPNRIFLMGHSAGAHLAALVATDPTYLGRYGIKPTDLAGIVLLDGGSYDMTDDTKLKKKAAKSDGGEESKAYAQAVGGQEAALSPILKIKAGEKYPPFLIFHVAGRPDSGGQSRKLAATLTGVGAAAVVIPAENKVHATIKREFGLSGDPVGERSALFFASAKL